MTQLNAFFESTQTLAIVALVIYLSYLKYKIRITQDFLNTMMAIYCHQHDMTIQEVFKIHDEMVAKDKVEAEV